MKKIFHKIHLWLSIPLGIIITIICLSGAILVFQDEVNEWKYPEKYFTKGISDNPMPIGRLVKIVNLKLEDNSISSVQISNDPSRNYVMGLKEGNRASVYVDPYTGEITGKSQRGEGFFSVILRLHRWLLGDSKSIGKPIVGYTTLFFVIILITGVVIWWPKDKKQFKRNLLINTRSGKKRFWMDLHVSGGIYLATGLLVLSLTGLYYSFDWYRKGLYGVLGIEMTDFHNQRQQGGQEQHKGNNPHYEKPETNLQDHPHERGHNPNYTGKHYTDNPRNREGKPPKGEGRPLDFQGSIRSDANPGQDRTAENENKQNRSEKPEYTEDAPQRKSGNMFTWQTVFNELKEKNPDSKTITIQNGSASVAQNFTFGNSRASDRYAFDNETGEITNVQLYKDQDGSTKVRGWIYSLHVGSWGGLFSKILTCIVSLIGASLPATGYYIYFVKRRKKNNRK